MQNQKTRDEKEGRRARHAMDKLHSVEPSQARKESKKKWQEGRREGGMKRGRMAVRRTWWTVYGCQEESMASHMHLTSLYEREQAAL